METCFYILHLKIDGLTANVSVNPPSLWSTTNHVCLYKPSTLSDVFPSRCSGQEIASVLQIPIINHTYFSSFSIIRVANVVHFACTRRLIFKSFRRGIIANNWVILGALEWRQDDTPCEMNADKTTFIATRFCRNENNVLLRILCFCFGCLGWN